MTVSIGLGQVGSNFCSLVVGWVGSVHTKMDPWTTLICLNIFQYVSLRLPLFFQSFSSFVSVAFLRLSQALSFGCEVPPKVRLYNAAVFYFLTFQTICLNIYPTNLFSVYRDDKTMAIDERSEVSFSIP